MHSEDSTFERKDNDLSVKDIVLKLQSWLKYLISKWLYIIVFAIIGAGIGFYIAWKKKTQYLATLTFVLEETKSSGLGAYAGIASQFGIDLGGGNGVGVFSGDNILEFLRSRLMIQKVLLSSFEDRPGSISMAEKYIEIFEMRNDWKDKPLLKTVKFPVNQDRSNFSRLQDSILNNIYDEIVKKRLAIIKPDRKLSYINLSCSSNDELFSKIFIEKLLTEASDFYIKTKTKRSQANIDKLQITVDSIQKLLNHKTYSVAETQDLNLNPARRIATVNTELATRDKGMLQTMYIEGVKNLELSKMAMSQETPIIQIIDAPILPLEKIKVSKLKALVVGGFLGGLIVALYFITVNLYKKIME